MQTEAAYQRVPRRRQRPHPCVLALPLLLLVAARQGGNATDRECAHYKAKDTKMQSKRNLFDCWQHTNGENGGRHS